MKEQKNKFNTSKVGRVLLVLMIAGQVFTGLQLLVPFFSSDPGLSSISAKLTN